MLLKPNPKEGMGAERAMYPCYELLAAGNYAGRTVPASSKIVLFLEFSCSPEN